MLQSLDTTTLAKYVAQQLNNLLPDFEVNGDTLYPFVKKAIERTEYCFSRINIKYFFDGNNVRFNHLNTDQYAMFLYYLSNTIWQLENDSLLAGKLYYLNKALNGLDAFYEIKLPDIFLLSHPVGAVLGRGDYSNYFVAYQRVTIGGNTELDYPTLGKAVAMYGGSAVIGKCNIGDGCLISFGTIVMEKTVPSNMVVFGKHPDISYKKTRKDVMELYFRS